jgi:hypothetical protein
MLLFAGNLSAREPKIERAITKNLSEQIAQYLRGIAIPVKETEKKAKIVFTLNGEKEMIVLAVHTVHPELAPLIKRQLNRKRLSVPNHIDGKNYIVPVKVVA